MSRLIRSAVGSPQRPQRGCGIFVAMIMIMMMMMMMVQGSRDNNPSTSLSINKKWSKMIPSFIVKKKSSDTINSAVEKEQDDNDSLVNNYSNFIAMRQQTHYLHSSLFQSLMKLRGGEEEDETDYDEESDSDDDDDDEDSDMYQKVLDVTKTKIVPVVMTYSKKAAITIKKASITFYYAMQRAISAGLEVVENDEEEEDDDDEDEEEEGDVYEVIAKKLIKFCTKSMKKIQRMVKAAMTIPEDEGSYEDNDDEDDDDENDKGNDFDAEENDDVTATESKDKEEEDDSSDLITSTSISSLDVKETSVEVESDEETTITNKIADFGSYLAENYSVEDKRTTDEDNDITIILGGSLSDACKIAREQARMLIVFIPSEKPKSESWFGGVGGGKQTNVNDQIAIESLLSDDVMKAANKKARKKGEAGLGSFAIWGSKTGSSEATSAIKRLKIKATATTGEKRPILCVVYPAQDGSAKVLAQHHCNPPLKAESMASWMNALRKRHGKQYQSMQTMYKENQYALERRDGYIDSVQSDTERKLKEAKEEAERKKKEVKEAARQAGIDARRQELKDSLPEDVTSGDNVKKIKLTFADGRSGQRGFASDQPLSVVFNWVDAMFETEREKVVLTTLNGKQTFSWNEEDIEETTLEDSGLKKMTAFRVSLSETNEKESKDE